MSRRTLCILAGAAFVYWLVSRRRAGMGDIPVGMKIAGDSSVLSNESSAAVAAAMGLPQGTPPQMSKLEAYRDRLVRYGMQIGLITRSYGCSMILRSPTESTLRNCRFDPGVTFEGAASFVADRLGYLNPETAQVTTPPMVNKPVVQIAPGVYAGGAVSTGAPTPIYGPNPQACANQTQGSLTTECLKAGGRYSHPKRCITAYGVLNWSPQYCKYMR